MNDQQRISMLEQKVAHLERRLAELTRLLKRSDDPEVVFAARRAS
ncbi:MAG TPA: hypothetical protein VFT50_14220 [Baekduia sp.]|nr:hypothetical protein [Baekduia sp.]